MWCPFYLGANASRSNACQEEKSRILILPVLRDVSAVSLEIVLNVVSNDGCDFCGELIQKSTDQFRGCSTTRFAVRSFKITSDVLNWLVLKQFFVQL